MAAVLALILTAGGASGCLPPPSLRDTPMRVEADLFSGRPNPAWMLDADEAADLADLLRLLAPSPAAPEPPGLGYRGITVRGVEPALPGCTALRAFRGAAVAECAVGPRTLADPARALERWLLETARHRLDAELFDVIEREIEG